MFNVSASKVESIIDFLDDMIDRVAPLVEPLAPAEIALAVPVADGLRNMADNLLTGHYGEITEPQLAIVGAAKQQLETAIAAGAVK